MDESGPKICGVSATFAILDPLTRAYYELKFRHDYNVAEGDAFQDLFVRVMSRAHPGDFTNVQPWGKDGDRKCDGYLTSTRTVFACFGPKSFSPIGKALTKVQSDHAGALKHWKPHMNEWTLVHNEHRGLPPRMLELLLKLKTVDSSVTVSNWDFEPLVSKVRSLTEPDLISLFGAAPSGAQVRALRHDDLKPVVLALTGALAADSTPADFRPVPPMKIEFNKLSPASRDLIVVGLQVADRVRKFFDHWEPGAGDRIALAFRTRYQELRADPTMTSDDILWSLYIFAGHGELASTRQQVAVLALVAFLFESCEIFERPPQGAPA